jgi:hypothetical protein
MTGDADSDSLERADPDAVVRKPFDARDLSSKLNVVLRPGWIRAAAASFKPRLR